MGIEKEGFWEVIKANEKCLLNEKRKTFVHLPCSMYVQLHMYSNGWALFVKLLSNIFSSFEASHCLRLPLRIWNRGFFFVDCCVCLYVCMYSQRNKLSLSLFFCIYNILQCESQWKSDSNSEWKFTQFSSLLWMHVTFYYVALFVIKFI